MDSVRENSIGVDTML